MEFILFDFFGVLSTPVYKTVMEKFIPKDEMPSWMAKLDLLDSGDLSEEELVSEISTRSDTSPEIIWNEVNNAPKPNLELFDFIEKQLKNKYKVGLLTNIPRSLIDRLFSDKVKLFDLVLVSSDLKLIKPNPEIFKEAIKRCDCLPSEIVFIDDSEKNIKVAKDVGLNGIVYKDFQSFENELRKFISI